MRNHRDVPATDATSDVLERTGRTMLRSLSASGLPGQSVGSGTVMKPALALGYRRSQILAAPKPYLTHQAAQYFRTPYSVAYEHVKRERTLAVLEGLFYEADQDKSAGVSLEEFRKCSQNLKCQKAFALFGVQPHQAEMVYRALDKTRQGNLTIDEFMNGFIELIGHEFNNDQFELDIDSLKPGRKHRKDNEGAVRSFVRSSSSPALYPADEFKRPLHVSAVPPRAAPRPSQVRPRIPLHMVRPGVRCIVHEHGVC